MVRAATVVPRSPVVDITGPVASFGVKDALTMLAGDTTHSQRPRVCAGMVSQAVESGGGLGRVRSLEFGQSERNCPARSFVFKPRSSEEISGLTRFHLQNPLNLWLGATQFVPPDGEMTETVEYGIKCKFQLCSRLTGSLVNRVEGFRKGFQTRHH